VAIMHHQHKKVLNSTFVTKNACTFDLINTLSEMFLVDTLQ